MRFRHIDIEKNKVSEVELLDPFLEWMLTNPPFTRSSACSGRQASGRIYKKAQLCDGGRHEDLEAKRHQAGKIRIDQVSYLDGGGIVFGPHPRDYSFSVPKKVCRAALKSALSLKFRDQKIIVLKDFPMEDIKTKKFKEVLDRFGLKSVLFVLDGSNESLEKSSRNLQDLKMMRSEGINVYDLMRYEHLILMEPSVKNIEGALIS